MTGSTHKIGGFTFSLLFLWINAYLQILPIAFISIYTPFFMVGCILGALFPDIDHPKATISRYLWPIAWPIYLTQKIIRAIFKKKKTQFAKNICSTVGHRGIAHWMTIAVAYMFLILCLLVYIRGYITLDITFSIVSFFLIGTTVGNVSHVVLDLFNETGLPLFAPFSFKRIHLANVKTGTRKSKKTIFTTSPSENIFILILLGITIFLIYLNLKAIGIDIPITAIQ